MQIKTAKFSLSTCKSSEPRFNLAYFKLSSRPNSNKSWSVSVTLTAIAQVIQDIKCYVRTDARTMGLPLLYIQAVPRAEAIVCKRPVYEATFLPTLEQGAEIAISICT